MGHLPPRVEPGRYLRKTDVVKIDQEVPVPASPLLEEHRTRDRIRRAVLERGPVTAAELAETLRLTPAAVRRQLDLLAADGLVAVHQATELHRGRGRPARRFVATEAGRAASDSGYDDLAGAAVTFLLRTAGPQAVSAFAAERVAELEDRYRPVVEAAGRDVRGRTEALAGALRADGYAASSRQVGADALASGTQLCQGHCPVQQVAAAFPQFCEAETQAFSRLLGVHVQRLATLAHGDHVCTTYVPAPGPGAGAGPDGPTGHPEHHSRRTGSPDGTRPRQRSTQATTERTTR